MARVRARSLEGRHLIGAGMLIMTVIPGYVASHMAVAAQKPHVVTVSSSLDSPIKEAAALYGVSEDLIAAVIEAESQFNPRAVSRRGARGLMQLMPATAVSLGVGDPFDPRENIHGGVRHLRRLIDRFDDNLPLALAAYNAGERAVLHHGGIPPYPETRRYVKQILRRLDRTSASPGRRA